MAVFALAPCHWLPLALCPIVGISLSTAAPVGAAPPDQSLRFPLDVKHAVHRPVLATVAFDKGFQPEGARKQAARGAPKAAKAASKPGTVNPGA